LSAIGIAGMDRLLQHNVLAMSGRAVEASGDVDVLLLDKTGNHHLATVRPLSSFLRRSSPSNVSLTPRNSRRSLTKTPEGRSIAVLAKEKFNLRGTRHCPAPRAICALHRPDRMSGVDFAAVDGQPARRIRKGAAEAMRVLVDREGGLFPKAVSDTVTTSPAPGAPACRHG